MDVGLLLPSLPFGRATNCLALTTLHRPRLAVSGLGLHRAPQVLVVRFRLLVQRKMRNISGDTDLH